MNKRASRSYFTKVASYFTYIGFFYELRAAQPEIEEPACLLLISHLFTDVLRIYFNVMEME